MLQRLFSPRVKVITEYTRAAPADSKDQEERSFVTLFRTMNTHTPACVFAACVPPAPLLVCVEHGLFPLPSVFECSLRHPLSLLLMLTLLSSPLCRCLQRAS